MKYKVVLSAGSSSPASVDASSSVSFFKYNDAYNAASIWSELATTNHAYLWNGSTWLTF